MGRKRGGLGSALTGVALLCTLLGSAAAPRPFHGSSAAQAQDSPQSVAEACALGLKVSDEEFFPGWLTCQELLDCTCALDAALAACCLPEDENCLWDPEHVPMFPDKSLCTDAQYKAIGAQSKACYDAGCQAACRRHGYTGGTPNEFTAAPAPIPACECQGTPAQPAPAQAVASITLTPEEGPRGSEVEVTGGGFPADADVELRWDQEDGVMVGEGRSDSAGGLRARVVMPLDAVDGEHRVVAVYRDASGTRSVAARFWVREHCISGRVALKLRGGLPLQGVRVSLWWSDPTLPFAPVAVIDTETASPWVAADAEGRYRICSPRIAIPSRDWLLQVELSEVQYRTYELFDEQTLTRAQGFFGAGRAIGADPGDVATWFAVEDELDLTRDLQFEDLEDRAETAAVREDHALDAALIYYHLHQAMRVFRELGAPLTATPVPVYVYSPRPTGAGAAGLDFSVGDSEWNDGNAPKNREWHEFAHYVMWSTYGGRFPPLHAEAGPGIDGDVNGNHILDEDTNHGGYLGNPLSSSDAVVEGLAEFMSLAIADRMNGQGEPYMQDLLAPYLYTVSDGAPIPQIYNYELNHPQNLLPSLPPEKRTAFYDDLKAQRSLDVGERLIRLPLSDEENCLASLLWDLYDPELPEDQDAIQLPLETLWGIWSRSYTFPQYYPGRVITGFLGDDQAYAGQWVYYDSTNELGSFQGERRRNAPFPSVQRNIWYVKDLYDALVQTLPDRARQIDQVFASHKVTLDTYRLYTDYTTVAAADLTTFAAPGAQIQASVGPEAAHEFWARGVVADVNAAGWGAGFTVDREPAFDARGFLYLWVWINAPVGTSFDLVVEDNNGQWLCPGTSEALYEVGEASADLALFQRGTGGWGASSPPGMGGGPWPFVAVLSPSGSAAEWKPSYDFRPNPNYKTPPASTSGPNIAQIRGIGVLFTSPGSYRALVGAMVVTLDYPWKAGMRTVYGIGDPAQAMWLPYRRDHPPLPGSKALLEVARTPATVILSLDYAPPYQDLSFRYPLTITRSPQEMWLYVEPPLDGQAGENRVSLSSEGGREVLSMTGSEFWTALGQAPYLAEARLPTGPGWDGLWILLGLAFASLLAIAVWVVASGARRRHRRRVATPPPGADDWWSDGGSVSTEYGGATDVDGSSAAWSDGGTGIDGWDEPAGGGPSAWPDTGDGLEGWDEPAGGTDSWPKS